LTRKSGVVLVRPDPILGIINCYAAETIRRRKRTEAGKKNGQEKGREEKRAKSYH
jgi:hypothetical protein